MQCSISTKAKADLSCSDVALHGGSCSYCNLSVLKAGDISALFHVVKMSAILRFTVVSTHKSCHQLCGGKGRHTCSQPLFLIFMLRLLELVPSMPHKQWCQCEVLQAQASSLKCGNQCQGIWASSDSLQMTWCGGTV